MTEAPEWPPARRLPDPRRLSVCDRYDEAPVAGDVREQDLAAVFGQSLPGPVPAHPQERRRAVLGADQEDVAPAAEVEVGRVIESAEAREAAARAPVPHD